MPLVFDVSVARGSGERFASSRILSGRVRPNASFRMQISFQTTLTIPTSLFIVVDIQHTCIPVHLYRQLQPHQQNAILSLPLT